MTINPVPLSAETLAKFVKIDNFFRRTYPDLTDEVHTLARLTKITEEVGELTNEIHAKLGFHRASPHKQVNLDNLSKEWADVFNTIILMGIALDLDINETITKRLKEIEDRYQLE